MLLDLSAFQELHLSIRFERTPASPDTSSRRNGVARDLSECGVVWWRRPQSFVIHDAVGSAVDRAFAFTEGRAAFSGLWLCLDTFWINHPTRDGKPHGRCISSRWRRRSVFRFRGRA